MGIAALSLIATGVGAAVSAYGSHEQGVAESNAAAYQSQVARNNQVIANQNAQAALQTGQQQEAAKREQTAQMIGQQRAAVAGSGIDPNSGSSQRIQGDTAAIGALDESVIRNNAARTAYGYQTQGMDFGAQAGLLQSESSSAASAGELSAFGSIVGGAASVSSKWLTQKAYGMWPSSSRASGSYATANGSGAQMPF